MLQMLAAAEAAEAQLLEGAEENLRRAVRCGTALVATKGVVTVLIRVCSTILDIGVGDETNDSPPRDALLSPSSSPISEQPKTEVAASVESSSSG
jgi:hypothetical protein